MPIFLLIGAFLTCIQAQFINANKFIYPISSSFILGGMKKTLDLSSPVSSHTRFARHAVLMLGASSGLSGLS